MHRSSGGPGVGVPRPLHHHHHKGPSASSPLSFDLEALLKIDDLRSWIQELEASRSHCYQTLYSDYDDYDSLSEDQPNGECGLCGAVTWRPVLCQPQVREIHLSPVCTVFSFQLRI